MAETQDVIIVGVEGGVTAWSTESTQKSIEAGIKQSNAQNTAIIALLKMVAKGESATQDQLNAVKVEIAKVAKVSAKGYATDKAANDSSAKSGVKNNNHFTAALNLLKINNGLLKTNERNAAARQQKVAQLMKMGASKSTADKTVDAGSMMLEAVKTVAKIVLVAKTFADTVKEAVSTGFTERFDMASDMRQSGLMAGMKESGDGFVKISKMVSDTGFTFGEAAEFTKRFSKAVGVTGVKSALDFAKEIANVDSKDGAMRKFNMDFGQIANMSGQYLESLRHAGQLQGRDKQELKAGMESFMSNVQMTSNVLKISMEEAAELMQKSVAPDQAGLLATLPKEMRMQVEDAMKAMNVQGGPMGEALAARLSAGSQQAFLQTDEYQNLAGTGVGQELLSFVNQISGSIESGSNEDFQAMIANEFPKFAESLQGFASQDGVRVQLLGNKQLAALVGQLLESAQTYGDAATGISGGGKEDRARMLANEQTRRATRMAEQSMTELMPEFTANLIKLTATNEAFAVQAAKTLVDYKGAIDTLVSGSVIAEQTITGGGTAALEGASWLGNLFGDNQSSQPTPEEIEKGYNDLGQNFGKVKTISVADQTVPHSDRLAANTQLFNEKSGDMFGGSISAAEEFAAKIDKSLSATTDAIITNATQGYNEKVMADLKKTADEQQLLLAAVKALVDQLKNN